MNEENKISIMANSKDIVIYKTQDSEISINVLVEDDTVWLSQIQMAQLFSTSKANITMHITNVFKEGELERISGSKKSLLPAPDGKQYNTNLYNLDVVISVGYRVKSPRGTQFRIWANKVLKDYIIKGYAVSQRFERLEYRVAETEKQIDFIVKTSLPPKEGIFYDGQIFDAFVFAVNLVKKATKSVTLIDNYVDESVLLLLSKRQNGVRASIYTKEISNTLQLDLQRHNAQYPEILIEEKPNIHDRFLLIDNELYHIGASLKDLGKKLFAFNKMEMTAEELLKNI